MKHLAAAFAIALLPLSGLAQGQPTAPQAEPAAEAQQPAPAAAVPPAKPAETSESTKPTLKVGDPAPVLSVDSWVKGEPVPAFEPGKVYVVEFFATWCVPCVASIPQMTAMQQKHKDLTVICIAGSEHIKTGQDDDRLANLQKFVDGQGAQMGYRVAYDSKKAMTLGWLKPAAQRGIPCGFIVNGQGKIAHIGHPLDKEFQRVMNEALEKAKALPVANGSPAPADARSSPAPVGTPANGAPAASPLPRT